MLRMKSLPDLGILVIRLALGAVFIGHGGQLVLGLWGGPGLMGVMQRFPTMGIPAPLAAVAAFTQLLGGLALAVGLLSRLAGLGILVEMAVAIWKVHLPHGFFLRNPETGQAGFEYNLALAAMAMAVMLIGAGRISLDHLIGGRKR